jgi:PAS domain S-box-containing protein
MDSPLVERPMPFPPPAGELHHSLADHLSQFVWAADPAGRPVYCNRHWHGYTGLTETQSLPDGWADVVHLDDLPAVRAAWERHCPAGTAYEYEARFRRADGVDRWHLAHVTPIRDEAGQIVRWVGSAVDIEDRKRAEAALQDSDRRKDEFLAVLGHELRGPLAPLRSGLEVLKRAGSDAAVAEPTLAMMERQMANLVRLVDDLLDVSRINRGKVTLRKEPLDLRVVVDRAVETVRPLIDARHHALEVELPPDAVPVNGDSVRLTQVVVNLLHNAAKYTEDGGRLRITTGREDGQAVLALCDSGMGILPEMLPTIFELFTQGQRAQDRAQGGLGIGLTVVKSLVELHGGTVMASSDGPGCGSLFTVRLPVAEGMIPAADSPPASTPAAAPRTLRVLVVDDSVDTARLTCLLLKLWGHDAHTAHDGPAALEVAAAVHPDVVLLDIGLPGINGYEVAARLRALPGLAGVNVVAVTGYGQDDDRRRSHAARFADHLVKPVEPAALQEMIGRLATVRET